MSTLQNVKTLWNATKSLCERAASSAAAGLIVTTAVTAVEACLIAHGVMIPPGALKLAKEGVGFIGAMASPIIDDFCKASLSTCAKIAASASTFKSAVRSMPPPYQLFDMGPVGTA